jgi:hypothetical protein
MVISSENIFQKNKTKLLFLSSAHDSSLPGPLRPNPRHRGPWPFGPAATTVSTIARRRNLDGGEVPDGEEHPNAITKLTRKHLGHYAVEHSHGQGTTATTAARRRPARRRTRQHDDVVR